MEDTMTKYIDAEKIEAEIERQKKTDGWCEVGKDTADVYYARGFRFACDNLLSFIDSLQQEQREVDLEEYVESEMKHYGLSLYEASYVTLSASQVERMIRNSYKLGFNARKENEK